MEGGDGKITLLIDGDIEAFRAATVNQENIDWGDEGVSVDTDAKGAEDYLVSALRHYRELLGVKRIIVCLSDGENWRKELWPDYKANRKDIARPLLLAHCREFLSKNYLTACWNRLEADDVMGILAQTIQGSVVVSIDKDMRTIPCRLFAPNHEELGIQNVDLFDAMRRHLIQTLMGDPVDGYKGCPGIGPKKAGAIIDEAFRRPDGSNRPGVDWAFDLNEERKKAWQAIVKTYERKGLTSEDALMNARMAYILHDPKDYNRRTCKVRLWRPHL